MTQAPPPSSLASQGSFGSIPNIAAAAAMFGIPGAAQSGVNPGGVDVGSLGPLGELNRLNHPAITQWLQQAQQAQQQQQQHQSLQDHSPPSNDEPMDRESSPHSSGGGGPGSDYAAL